MHELGIMNDVLETALKVAENNNGTKVTEIRLKIGVMSGVVPRYVQSFFDVISKDTPAEGAKIDIVMDPAVFECHDCGEKTSFSALNPGYKCHACQSASLKLLSGYGFQITSVAIV